MHALWRLLWRSAVGFWIVFILVVVVSDPVMKMDHTPWDLVALLAAGDILPGDLRGVYMSIALFALLVGLLVGRVTKELQHAEFAFTLPDLRRKLFAGALLIMAVAAAPAAIAGGALHGVVGAVPFAAVSLLLYAVSTAAWDPVDSRIVSIGSLGTMIAAFFGSEELYVAAEVAPIATTGLATAGAAVWLVREYSAAAARARPFLPAWPLGTGGERRWYLDRTATTPAGTRTWRVHPRPGRLFDWIRATEYEVFGRYRFGWAGWTVVVAAVAAAVLWAWGGDQPEIAAWATMLALFHVTTRSAFLHWRVPYPLSRRERARVIWWTSLVNNAGICLALAGFVWAATLLPPTPFDSPPLAHVHGPLRFVPFLFATLPVAQGIQERWLRPESTERNPVAAVLVVVAMYMVTGVAVVVLAATTAGWEATVVAMLLALLTHGLYRWALDRRYRTDDLA